MPNEVTSLLNILNSYITCPVCKITNEIEIILTCGHLICQNCKTRCIKCPLCNSELTGTRPHSPSVKFIKELREELLNVSTGELKSTKTDFIGNSNENNSNLKGKETTRNVFKTTSIEKLKKNINLGVKDNVEFNSNVVKVINEINAFRKTDYNRKNSNHKEGIVFYKNNHSRHKEEQKVYRKILKGLGIVGIDRQIKKVKSKHALIEEENKLNGQLRSIISRLNDHYPNNNNLDHSSKIISGSSGSDQIIKMNYRTSMNIDSKNNIMKSDSNRNGFSLTKSSNVLKRKKVDSSSEEGPCKKSLKNADIVDDCSTCASADPISFNKTLGSIVDETELIQRYLNPSMIGTEEKEIKDTIKPGNNLCTDPLDFPPKKPEYANKGLDESITSDENCKKLSKSDIVNIVSEYMVDVNPSSEEDGLLSDIMVDMLHNVSKEIFVVGNNLCTAENKFENDNSLINDSHDGSKQNYSKTLAIKKETESGYGDNNVVVVSDSEDDGDFINKHSVSNSSQTQTDKTDIHLENVSNMDCEIGAKKKGIKDTIKSCHSFSTDPLDFLSQKPECASEGFSQTNETITGNKNGKRLSRSDIMNIVSEHMVDISPCSEEDSLQSDIMVDMLHNISNEIVVGKNLCIDEKNVENDNSSINDSYDVSKENHSKTHSLAIKKETDSDYGDNNVVVVSDSEDDGKLIKQHSFSNSSQTQTDKADIHLENVNIMNCKIILNDLAPLMFPSPEKNIQTSKDECLGKSNVKKKLIKDSTATNRKMNQKNIRLKKVKCCADEKKSTTGKNNINLIQNAKVPLEPKRDTFEETLNSFEGFNEDDILILTVKLALFKMNSSKYSNKLSCTSLYALDGKQILIKDVSQERSQDSPCCTTKISDLTIEISDSEDESSKSFVTSSVQTENELLTVTPSPSTSKIRPVSLVKLRGFEIENEKFMQNDILDVRTPLTPNTPLGKESIASPLPQKSPAKTTPVSRRQLSFMSPSFSNDLQYEDIGASTSDTKTTESVPKSSVNDDWQVLHYRMQHMIPSYSDDTLLNELERSDISATRLTFTTCGLNSKETALVTKLAQMTKSCLTKDFTHNTTHLVIGATGRGRLEYYLAIAYRAFIVTMDWVTLCLALNKILPVTGFIPTEDEGPLKCLEPNSLPFAGFHVFSKILPTSSSYPIAEITKTLLSLGGARVLPNLDAFHTLQDGHYPRFFVYNSKATLTQPVLDKCASLHILPIQFMWVYESIGAFRAIPVMDFLDVIVHSRTLIRDYKIPDQLACSRYPRLEGEFHPPILDERYQRSL